MTGGQGLKGELPRFVVVGIVAVLIDGAGYFALIRFLGVSPDWAKRASFAMGAGWAYFANKFITFRKPGFAISEPMAFAAVYLVGWLANSVVHDYALRLTASSVLAFLAATFVSTCTNFAGQKWIVFRHKVRER